MADEELTAEQVQAGTQVAQAGVEAAAAEPDKGRKRSAAVRAMRHRAQQVNLELSDEDCEKIADMFIDKMEARGAFDPPPEPVAAPAPYPQPAAAPAEAEAPPRPKTFAERFRSS